MKNSFMIAGNRLIFCFIGFVFSAITLTAKEANGYIIKNNDKTEKGVVFITHIDQVSGGLIFNGFDEQVLHSSVIFMAEGRDSFKVYRPDEIEGFGFYYKDQEYVYHSFNLTRESLVKSEREKYRFLQLIHKNNIVSLYRNRSYLKQTANERFNKHYKNANTFELYLYNEETGLTRAQKSDDYKNVRELLLEYNVEQEFLNELPRKYKFRHLKIILQKYAEWSENKNSDQV